MLVLTRQVNEIIMIGDNIEITVVAVKGDKVKIGIKAPTSIGVYRKEVYDAIREENIRAAAAPKESMLDALLKLKVPIKKDDKKKKKDSDAKV